MPHRCLASGPRRGLGRRANRAGREGKIMSGSECWELWERALPAVSPGDVWEHSATAPLPNRPRGESVTGQAPLSKQDSVGRARRLHRAGFLRASRQLAGWARVWAGADLGRQRWESSRGCVRCPLPVAPWQGPRGAIPGVPVVPSLKERGALGDLCGSLLAPAGPGAHATCHELPQVSAWPLAGRSSPWVCGRRGQRRTGRLVAAAVTQ